MQTFFLWAAAFQWQASPEGADHRTESFAWRLTEFANAQAFDDTEIMYGTDEHDLVKSP
jgi:hypothetical protein